MQKDLNECTMQELVKIYNSHASIPVKGFHDKTTAKRRVEELLGTVQEAPEIIAPPEKKIKKTDILRQCFKEKPVWDRDELIARTGQRHIHQTLTLLKNPRRTSPNKLLITTYDKVTETFSLVEGSNGEMDNA